MSSSVHFKFKSQKEPSRVTFDGTGISVFELKREIINQSRLGDGSDFELSIYNEDTGEGKLCGFVLITFLRAGVSRKKPENSEKGKPESVIVDLFLQSMMMIPQSFPVPLLLSLGGCLPLGLAKAALLVMYLGKCPLALAVRLVMMLQCRPELYQILAAQ